MSSATTIRISGVNLAPNKHIVVALTALYGIGKTTAKKICETCGISPDTKSKDIPHDLEETLRKEVLKYEIEGDLRRKVAMNIKRLIDLKCFRGLRHVRKLPCRGQRTKTNARTRKGRKRIPKEAAK